MENVTKSHDGLMKQLDQYEKECLITLKNKHEPETSSFKLIQNQLVVSLDIIYNSLGIKYYIN